MTRSRAPEPEDEVSLVRQVAELKASVDAFRESTIGREEYTRRHRRVVAGVVAVLVLLVLGAIDFWQERAEDESDRREAVRADQVICRKQNEIKALELQEEREESIPFPIPTNGDTGLAKTIEEANRRIAASLARAEQTLTPTPCPSLIRERLTVATVAS